MRGILAAFEVALGALHLLVADTRGSDWVVEGIGLASIGAISIVLGIALVRSRGQWPLVTSMVLNISIIIGLVVTRTSGYPFGPYEAIAAPVGAYEILVLVICSLTVSMGGATLILGRNRIGAPGWRFDTLAPVAIVVVAVPGLAVSSWADDVAYFAGAAHVHGGTTINSSTQHGFAYRAELTPEERIRLGDELTAARAVALTTPTLADAVAAGWTAVGEPVVGAGQMVIDLARRRADVGFDPPSPVALLFASADADAPIVAVQYEGWTKSTTPPPGFTGQDIFWHLHTGTCLVGDVRVVYDPPHVGTECELIGGTRTNTFSWMIRAWVVAG